MSLNRKLELIICKPTYANFGAVSIKLKNKNVLGFIFEEFEMRVVMCERIDEENRLRTLIYSIAYMEYSNETISHLRTKGNILAYILIVALSKSISKLYPHQLRSIK